MTLTEETTHRLRSDLIDGVRRHQRRRSMRRRAVVIPLAFTAVTAAAVLYPSDRNPAYALTVGADGTIRVQIHPEFNDVGQLQEELRSVGLDVNVVHLKGHPSLDRLVEVVSHDNERNGALKFDGAEFELDRQAAEGQIEILIYSAADPGQPYQFSPSIFSIGQPLEGLHCAYADGQLSTDEFERRASEVGLDDIEWVYFDRVPTTEGVTASEPEDRPEGMVVDAHWADEDTIRAIVYPNTDEPASDTIIMYDGSHDPAEQACTPDLAARWE